MTFKCILDLEVCHKVYTVRAKCLCHQSKIYLILYYKGDIKLDHDPKFENLKKKVIIVRWKQWRLLEPPRPLTLMNGQESRHLPVSFYTNAYKIAAAFEDLYGQFLQYRVHFMWNNPKVDFQPPWVLKKTFYYIIFFFCFAYCLSFASLVSYLAYLVAT